MEFSAWMNGMEVAITVCNLDGIIVFMNDQAARTFAAEGGKALLGKRLWECHPESAREKIRCLLATGDSNSYTIEKKGLRKLIHQVPWRESGKLAGLVEFSFVVPLAMPHFIRG